MPGGVAEGEKGKKEAQDIGQPVPADAERVPQPVPLEKIGREVVNKERVGH